MILGPFFKLIRWKNLLILAVTLIIIKVGFIDIFTIHSSLNIPNFLILLASNLFIAAAGYIINDILDVETDKINKPSKVFINNSIPIKLAYNLYFTLNVLGVIGGFYIANFLKFPVLALIPISISYLLYLYSTTLKKVPFIGNLLIASLISLSILTLAFFDLILTENSEILGYHYTLFLVLVDFSIFAFLINLIREIIKDIEDIKGDSLLNMRTLPILAGIKFTKNLLSILVLLLISGVGYFVFKYLPNDTLIFYYFIISIIAPLLYLLIKLQKATLKSDYNFLSLLLKIIMVFGTFAILLISLTIKNVL